MIVTLLKMKTKLSDNHLQISLHYKKHVLEYEKIRLSQDSPAEYAVTLKIIDQWIKDNSKVVDVGVGVGHYALHLAERHCRIVLVDIVEEFLEAAKNKLAEVNLENQIIQSALASATDLNFIENASADAVLLFGPLYHLPIK